MSVGDYHRSVDRRRLCLVTGSANLLLPGGDGRDDVHHIALVADLLQHV